MEAAATIHAVNIHNFKRKKSRVITQRPLSWNKYSFNHLCYFSADKRLSRTPRRTQQPKTLNTPEDSTYYNLIHVSQRETNDFRQYNKAWLCSAMCPCNYFPSNFFPQSTIDCQFLCVCSALNYIMFPRQETSDYFKVAWKSFFSTLM